MATHDDEDESAGVIAGVLGGIVLCAVAVIYAGGGLVRMPQAVAAVEIAPIGEPLAKVYFDVGQAKLLDADQGVVARTMDAMAAKPSAIVLLSGFHDPSGNAQQNAVLAKQRAEAVRDALIAGGVDGKRIKLRRPETTLGSGSPQEGRRVEIRVQ